MVNIKYKTENSLIADFLNWTNLNDESFPEYVNLNGNFYSSKDLLFNSDWNWLMEVVEKIQSVPSYDKDRFGTIVKIEGRNCHIKSDNYGSKNKEYSKEQYFNGNYGGDTKIEATYNACVAFIKWYNEQNK